MGIERYPPTRPVGRLFEDMKGPPPAIPDLLLISAEGQWLHEVRHGLQRSFAARLETFGSAKNLAIIGVPTQVLNAFKLGMNRNLPAMDLDELGSCLHSVAPGSRGLKAHK